MRTLALVLALVATAGCSILRTRSVAQHGAERCTTSVGPAAVDTLLVVGAAAVAVYSALELEDVDHIAIPGATGAGVIFGISAGVGYHRATGCKRARIREGIAY